MEPLFINDDAWKTIWGGLDEDTQKDIAVLLMVAPEQTVRRVVADSFWAGAHEA